MEERRPVNRFCSNPGERGQRELQVKCGGEKAKFDIDLWFTNLIWKVTERKGLNFWYECIVLTFI